MGLLSRLTATLTATSTDDGCGWWVVGAVVLAAESVAQGVDGPLESESYVGVDAGVGVPEKFLDHDEVDPLFQEQGGSRMPEVVEADAAEAGPVE